MKHMIIENIDRLTVDELRILKEALDIKNITLKEVECYGTQEPPKLKVFKVKFKSLAPTNCGLIIAAADIEAATALAGETIKHTHPQTVEELDITAESVLLYHDGDY